MPVFDDVPPGNHAFGCLDGHTCGNPVRLVTSGGPRLRGETMSERRLDFVANHDWVRRALMFEPRGHDVMSGAILYPPTRDDCDAAVLFIETSGCLPMCGHGTIGAVSMAVEHGLLTPGADGVLSLDTPAGVVRAAVTRDGAHVSSVRIRNVASYLAAAEVALDVDGLVVDVAYGGNFYAIVSPQPGYAGLDALGVEGVRRLSPLVREAARRAVRPVHPLDQSIAGVSHVMWTDTPKHPRAHGRNAVFYGDAAIDRSPCGTGTSARMAQLVARGGLHVGDEFVHESIIGTLFEGRVEAATELAGTAAIVPSVAGWARLTGINTIFVDPRDPLAGGFQLI